MITVQKVCLCVHVETQHFTLDYTDHTLNALQFHLPYNRCSPYTVANGFNTVMQLTAKTL